MQMNPKNIARLITEDPDVFQAHDWEKEKTIEIEGLLIGKQPFFVTCVIGFDISTISSSINPVEQNFDWGVAEILEVVGDNGPIELTPESSKKVEEAIMSHLSDRDVMDQVCPNKECEYDRDDYDYDDYRDKKYEL